MKEQLENEKLRLICFKSASELGKSVDKQLVEMYGYDPKKYTFLVPINEYFFEDGHSKVEINSTVRGKELFFLTDIGNYSISYKMHGFYNHTSPNDLIQQLKDGINASNCHADNINIVMPLLYNGRQHRRKTREPLSCGATLRELDNLPRIKSLITFDAHDQGVEHATHNMEFDNVFVTNIILEHFINDVPAEQLKNMVFVAPDSGANGRRDIYLNSFNSEQVNRDAGGFYKVRDFNHFEDGKYPVISHEYIGHSDLSGKTAIVVDDMISSGGSMFDTIEVLKSKGADHIYIMVTYSLFTKGIKDFRNYYDKKMLDGLYVSNLSYIPEEYREEPWLHVCDCSRTVAEVIYNIHHDQSITSILTDRSEPIKLLEKKFKMKDIIENIENGNLVIVPTDTVYGISCDATNKEAVEKVFLAKKREKKPLIVMVSSIDMLKKYVKPLNDLEQKLIYKYWPNSLTVLFKKKNNLPDEITCGSDYVGIRMPDNKFLLDLMEKINKPIVSTSANISGSSVITKTDMIDPALRKHISYVYDDGEKTNVASTLIQVDGYKIKILREGELAEQIRNDFKEFIDE